MYAALRSPEDDSWTPDERTPAWPSYRCSSCVSRWHYYWRHGSDSREDDRVGFGRLLQAVAVVSFRYNVICSRQSNEQEVVYNQIARGISVGRVNSTAAAIAELRPVYPDDPEFRSAFADKALRTTSSRNNKVVRFNAVPAGSAVVGTTL